VNRALLFLALRVRRNRLRQFVRGLRRPKKAIALLLWLALLGFLVYAQVRVRTHASAGTRPETVFGVLGFILLASVLNGLVQRGLAFLPSDVDFLFAGPFSRRALVLYRLVTLYPVTLVSGAIFFFILGVRPAHPGLGLAAFLLGHLSALHVQTIVALLAVHLSERVFVRLRRGARFVGVLLGAGTLLLLVLSTSARGGPGRTLAGLADSPATRVLLYPAAAAARAVAAVDLRDAAASVAGLLLFAAGSFALVLALDVRFFEASLATSARLATLLARARRGLPAGGTPEEGMVRSLSLPRLGLFRGAGAVFWKNLAAVRRSGRLLFTGFCFSLLMALPGVLAGRQSPGGSAAVGSVVLALVGMLPFMMQPYLAFDFRRDADHLVELKSLPVSPFGMAAAQVAAPTLLALAFQMLLLVLLAAFGAVDAGSLALAALGFPATTLGCLTSANVAFLLFPTRAPSEGTRPNPSAGLAISLLGLIASLVPAGGILWLFLASGAGPGVALGAAILTQYGIDLLLLAALGEVFRRLDPATEVR
jgi:hypothetical protein